MSLTAFMKAERGGFCSKYTLAKLTAINCKRAQLFGRRLTLSIIHSTTMGSSKASVEPVNSMDSHCAVESNKTETCMLYSSTVPQSAKSNSTGKGYGNHFKKAMNASVILSFVLLHCVWCLEVQEPSQI